MIEISGIFHLVKWPLIILFGIIILVGAVGFALELIRGEKKKDLSAFIKRKYLFDAPSEFQLFKILLELYGDRFHIFPQVHYSHIVEVRKNLPYPTRIAYWNKINRKSADFVFCDREHIVPQLVIELDGSSHKREDRQERDEFINELMRVTELRICHLHPERMDRDYVKTAIDGALFPALEPISEKA